MSSSTPSQRQSPPVVEGDILADRYEVVRVIGAGGMGVVVEARHIQLGQRVALKFLLSEECSEEAVGRFLREGRAVVQIKSEHVAHVSDVGTLDNGAPYMVMEYLEGADLSEVLARRGRLPIQEAVEYVLQPCEAIAEAHALGIIHRDLKPANLFLAHRADGSALIKVLDFGISKLEGDLQQVSLTDSTGAMGSPQYMSPEQMRSAKYVDRRTDIWAIGAILYEFLSGRPPFEADSLIGLCTLVATKNASPLRDRFEDVPEGLEAAVLRCLRREPSERYASLAELASDLMPFAGQTGRMSANRIVTILKDAGFDGVPVPSQSETESAPDNLPPKRSPTGRRSAIVMIAIGVTALAFAIGWGRSYGSNDAPRSEGVPIASSSTVVVADVVSDLVTEATAEAVETAPAVSVPEAGATRSLSTKRAGPATPLAPPVPPVPPAVASSSVLAPPAAPPATKSLPDFGGRHY